MTACFGTQPLQWQARGLEVGETHHRAGSSTPWHAHEGLCIHLVLSGAYAEESAGDAIVAGPGEIVAKPAGLRHRNHFGSSPTRSLRLQAASPREGSRELPGLTRIESFEARALAGQIRHELRVADELSSDAIAALAPALVSSVLCAIHRRPVKATRAGRDFLGACLEILHAEFRRSLRVTEIARELGVDRSHLSRSFLRTQGCSIGAYIRRLRVRECERLLAATDAPLVQIAIESGFSDQSHCTRVFRELMGTTPARWREHELGG